MASPAILAIKIVSDATKAAREFDKIGKKTSKWQQGTQKAGKVAGRFLLAVGGGAAVLTHYGEQAATSNSRIEQINRSMGLFGKQSDIVSQRLEKQAETQARATGVDQNAIKLTEAKLLTFKEIAKSADKVGGAFDRATTASVDLAAAGFGTADANAVQLGKALNDPIKGISALTRVGLTFTDKQKKVIKRLQDTGDMAGAQNVVLKAIEQQVGGTAVATANSTDKMKVAWSQVAETFGTLLLPMVDKVTGAVEKLTGWMQEHQGTVIAVVGALVGLAVIVKTVQIATSVYTAAVNLSAAAAKAWAFASKIVTGVQWALNAAMEANPIGLVVAAVVLLIAAFVILYKRSDKVRRIVDRVFGFIKRVGIAAIHGVVGFIKRHWQMVALLVAPLALAVVKVVQHWRRIKDFIGDRVADIVDKFTGLKDKILGAISGAGSWLIDTGRNIVSGLMTGIDSVAGKIGSYFLNKIPSWIRSPFEHALGISSPSRVFSGYGEQIVEGLAMGTRKLRGLAAVAGTELSTAVSRGFEAPNLRLASSGTALGAAGGTGGDTFQITVNGALDPVAVGDQLDKILKRRARRLSA